MDSLIGDAVVVAEDSIDVNFVVAQEERQRHSTSANGNCNKKKKNNKYERRRRKSQRARDEEKTGRQEEQQQQRHTAVDASSSSAGTTTTAPCDDEKAADRAAVDDDDVRRRRNNNSTDSDDAGGDSCSASSSSDDDDDNDFEVVPAADATLRERRLQEQDGNDDDESNESDREDRQQQRHYLLDDVEERAAYLSEFHARPLELDRRSGVSSNLHRQLQSERSSKRSSHLFSEAREWSDFDTNKLLHERLIKAVRDDFQLCRPTVIQSKSIPAFLTTTATTIPTTTKGDDNAGSSSSGNSNGNSNNTNVLLHSETGSGKTLAYLLPILQSLAVNARTGRLDKVDRGSGGTRCVILCPTRELAVQTLTVAERLCSKTFNWLVPGCLFGEERRKSEKARIRKGISVLIATPGRLLDHLTRTESLLMSLKGRLDWLVLDEADRLLDMGLGAQVQQIVQRIRANQPGSGRNGVTWRSVLVSATVTPSVERLAKETLGGDGSWVWVTGKAISSSEADDRGSNGGSLAAAVDDKNDENEKVSFAESTPRQLSQLHMTVSAKLRLPALVAFLVQRVKKGERTVVFLSTCASVDYYHALFQAMDSIVPSKGSQDSGASSSSSAGVFGSRCSIYKLHGSIPHGERQQTLKRFIKVKSSKSGLEQKKNAAILFATDVAARGLNLPDVDWTVQYDPPSEVSDYVHRVGRVARAGKAGHSLLFLLPSERQFLDILKKHGVKQVSALSLTATLNVAASICSVLTEEGARRSGGGFGSSTQGGSRGVLASSRSGEAFATEVQRRLEDCVTADDAKARTTAKEKNRKQYYRQRTRGGDDEDTGALIQLARLAFVSHIRAYPTKEKLVRQVFCAKSLHLGHVARSFALKEPPKKLAKNRSNAHGMLENANSKRKRNTAMSFKPLDGDEDGDGVVEDKVIDRYPPEKRQKGAKALLMANAAKLEQMIGVDGM